MQIFIEYNFDVVSKKIYEVKFCFQEHYDC